MTPLLRLSLLLLIPSAAPAAQERFYTGNYTRPGQGEGIYTCVLDSDTGKLGPVTLAGKANGPSYVALSPDATHLYACTSDQGGSVTAFSVNKDGTLTLLNSVPCGSGPCDVAVDPSGKNAFAANYGGGSIACIKIKDDGSLGERTSVVNFEGSGPDPVRQKKPFGHFITTDSSGQFIYACDLGTDHVWSYHFDEASGRFKDKTDTEGTVAPGSGPRHLAFGPGQNFAYVNGEMGRNVTTFSRDKKTGALTAIQSQPLFPGAAPADGITTAETICHPNGKWVYISSRGDDIISVFSIGQDGKLTYVQNVPALVKVPRGFNIDPSGKWLVSAGQSDNQIAVLSIAQDTGKLTATDERATVPTPVCILFAPAH